MASNIYNQGYYSSLVKLGFDKDAGAIGNVVNRAKGFVGRGLETMGGRGAAESEAAFMRGTGKARTVAKKAPKAPKAAKTPPSNWVPYQGNPMATAKPMNPLVPMSAEEAAKAAPKPGILGTLKAHPYLAGGAALAGGYGVYRHGQDLAQPQQPMQAQYPIY